jgi:hypothetical protein
MKVNFKQIGVAAAVAAVSASFAGSVNAQPTRAAGNIGDLAVIPYYTVQDDWATGVHIINTSNTTQVVKLRLRRATDSADALDFNLILSPKDEWTGALSDDGAGNISMRTDDASCTAPVRADGVFQMPAIYRPGADEGYIEVISMGTAAATSPIAIAAKHASGVPADCSAVASNFFANVSLAGAGDPSLKGNISNASTHQTATGPEVTAYIAAGNVCVDSAGDAITVSPAGLIPGVCATAYTGETNALAVSYFIRDAASGIEFGGNAVHIADFSDLPMMTNQETGLFSGDVYGFDYPDLDGGPWVGPDLGTTTRGLFNGLRDPSVLGVSNVLNDWSVATARNVSTDWVVTMPGQYTMVDAFTWLQSGFGATCGQVAIPSTGQTPVPLCDFRDIPVTATLTLYDREEGVVIPESGDLVISPAPPGTTNAFILPNEVNVIEWTDGTNTPVLGSDVAASVDASVLGDYGWANLSVASNAAKDQLICSNFGPTLDAFSTSGNRQGPYGVDGAGAPDGSLVDICYDATGFVPIAGFVAWERSFPTNPDGNYGRLIDHSFGASTP